jgi:hypothetical protein
MASTAIPVVKAAVLGALQGAEALEGITVTADREPERDSEYVWIWRAKAKRNFRTIGPSPAPLDEEVSIVMRVVAIGGDPEARALELADAVEEALREDITLGDSVLWHRLEELEQEPLQFDRKAGCHVLMTLTAKARI